MKAARLDEGYLVEILNGHRYGAVSVNGEGKTQFNFLNSQEIRAILLNKPKDFVKKLIEGQSNSMTFVRGLDREFGSGDERERAFKSYLRVLRECEDYLDEMESSFKPYTPFKDFEEIVLVEDRSNP